MSKIKTVTNAQTIALFNEFVKANKEAFAAFIDGMDNVTVDEFIAKGDKIHAALTKPRTKGDSATAKQNAADAERLAAMMQPDQVVTNKWICEHMGYQHSQKATVVVNVAKAMGLIEEAPKVKKSDPKGYKLV